MKSRPLSWITGQTIRALWTVKGPSFMRFRGESGNIHFIEKACESDTAIYHRLVETCFDYQGKWKRWLLFYGITNMQEVKV